MRRLEQISPLGLTGLPARLAEILHKGSHCRNGSARNRLLFLVRHSAGNARAGIRVARPEQLGHPYCRVDLLLGRFQGAHVLRDGGDEQCQDDLGKERVSAVYGFG